MSQLEDVTRQDNPANDAGGVERRINWPLFVVLLAGSCTLAWIYFWLRAIVSAVQAAFI